MREIITKVYSFEELDAVAKEKARDWYRQADVGWDWYQLTLDDAKDCAKLFGLQIDDIYFELHIQGAGARFVGRYAYEKGGLAAVIKDRPEDEELHRIVRELQAIQSRNFYSLTASIKCGRDNMRVEVEDQRHNYGWLSDGNTAEKEIRDCMRDFAAWIYKRLDDKWEYLNSDEVVDESIIASEYEFTESGKRFVP